MSIITFAKALNTLLTTINRKLENNKNSKINRKNLVNKYKGLVKREWRKIRKRESKEGIIFLFNRRISELFSGLRDNIFTGEFIEKLVSKKRLDYITKFACLMKTQNIRNILLNITDDTEIYIINNIEFKFNFDIKEEVDWSAFTKLKFYQDELFHNLLNNEFIEEEIIYLDEVKINDDEFIEEDERKKIAYTIKPLQLSNIEYSTDIHMMEFELSEINKKYSTHKIKKLI